MKSIIARLPRGLFHLAILILAVATAPRAHAGLTVELNLIRYNYGDNYGYYFSPSLTTNTTAPLVSFGDYSVASSGAPTNGSHGEYRCDANGLNQTGGGSWGYNDFPSFVYQLTNGNWSIAITNATITNIFYFKVSTSITSNSLPNVVVSFPTNGAVNVTNQPTFRWQGPTNYNALVIYQFNYSSYLPVTQTNLASPRVLYQGNNGFTVHYDAYSTNTIITGTTPTNGANSLAGWVTATHLQTYFGSQFSVGSVDTSGTSHTLVARYAWDGTNVDGSASGTDSSGNGYDMNFGGGQGGQGGVNSTTNALTGPRAIQFHDGDGNSAGYVGWNPTPSALLSTLADSFSISCWIKTTQNNLGWDDAPAEYGAGIVAADNGGVANDLIPLALTGSKAAFNTGGDSEDVTLNSAAAVNDGNYHHIVVTRNRLTGQKIFYIDGIFDSFSSGTTNLLNSPQLLTLGAIADAGNPNAATTSYYKGYDGQLDDLQIYSGALSSNEVAGLFANPGSTAVNSGSGGGHTNIAHYTFDTASTNTFDLGLDSSPRNNNFITYSYWGQPHTNATDSVAGGRAVQFFGTSGMISYDQVLTNLNAVLAGSFTFSTWVKTTASRGNNSDNAYFGATLFWAYNIAGNTNDTIPLAITGSKVAFTTRDHLGNFNTLHSTTSVNNGSYHLITATRNQATGEKRIYVDGNFEASEFGTTEPLNGTNYDVSLGGSVYSSYTGLMDDFQIYAGALDASEVSSLYNNPGSTVADAAGGGGGSVTLAEAVDATNLVWTTGGNANWSGQTTTSHDSVDAARSGPLATGSFQSTYIETTVTGPCTVSFWWRNIVGDSGFYTDFFIDGNYQNEIYDTTTWAQDGPYTLGVGAHTLRWQAFDDGTLDTNAAGFLDQVVVTPILLPAITLDPFSQTNRPAYQVALLTDGTSPTNSPTFQWYKVGPGLITGATNKLYIPPNSGTAGVAGNYFAVASNPAGSVTSATATVTFVSATVPPDWTTAFKSSLLGGNNGERRTNYGICLLLDASGTNLYSANSYTGTNTFGSDTVISGPGKFSTVLMKQTTNGTSLWARSLTNTGNGNSYPQSIAPAPGGVYVSGVFSGTNGLGTNSLVETAGGSTYLARFDTNGNVLWVRTIIGTNANFQSYHQLAADPAGNVTVSSLINNTVTIGSTNITAPGQKGLLVQFDANGNLRWTQVLSGWASYLTYSSGVIYGSLGGNPTNFIGGITNTSDRQWTIFALNATNGQALWLRNIASAQGQSAPADQPDVTVSGTNVFVIGTAAGGSAQFGAINLSWPENFRQYFARYDTNGTAQLATTFGSETVFPWTAVADASGNVYVGGDFDTYATFGSNIVAGYRKETIGGSNPGQTFVAKFDRNGNSLWARTAQSSNYYVNCRDLALANDGIWTYGFVMQSANFGSNQVFGTTFILSSQLFTLVGGAFGKITDAAPPAIPNPITLLSPTNSATQFQFSFNSQSGFTHSVLYRTNLAIGTWQTYSNVTGDGSLKTIPIPASVFGGSKHAFIRISTQ